jgi:hypothetical protein
MTRSETVNEYCLAYVYIKAGATEIKASDIEDTRGDNTVCGWVTGLIEQLSTTTLFTQWESLFNNWFNNLQDLINENTETMLVGALPKSDTVTLSAGAWVSSDNGYTQTVAVDGITSTKTVICQSNDETAEAHANAGVKCDGQDVDTLVFSAINLPATDVKVNITHFGL